MTEHAVVIVGGLLNLCEPGDLDIMPWADRVRQIDARYVVTWELPVLGAVLLRAPC